jgi:diketogulonate reductase-like aldo/keto reductase
MKKLTEEERDILQELVRESDNVERTCKNLGVEYTDEMLVNWLNNTAHYRINGPKACASQTTAPNNTQDPTVKKMEQIVKGDNLDMIEEAAEKKGLI